MRIRCIVCSVEFEHDISASLFSFVHRVRVCENCLTRSISSLFSSFSTLNGTFIHTKIDETSSGIPFLTDSEVFAIQENYSIAWNTSEKTRNMLMGLTRSIVQTQMNLKPIDAAMNMRAIIILFDNPGLLQTRYRDDVVGPFLRVIASLPKRLHDNLYEWWRSCASTSGPRSVSFRNTITVIQQYITGILFDAVSAAQVRSLSGTSSRNNNCDLRRDLVTTKNLEAALEVLSILYWANESNNLLPFQHFYNDAVNDFVNIERDFQAWVSGNEFAFHRFPFVLSLANKSIAIRSDAIRQQRIQCRATLATLLSGVVESPYLRLTLRRNMIVEDTLTQIEQLLTATSRPMAAASASNAQTLTPRGSPTIGRSAVSSLELELDIGQVQTQTSNALNKPVQVQFVGEGEIGGGGVTREFFQVIVSELFDPRRGLFTWSNETRLSYFNPDARTRESDRLFHLAGIVVGLAIYNGVILDIHLPLSVFGRLMNRPMTLDDLSELNPGAAQGLRDLLLCDERIEEKFGVTFSAALANEEGAVREVIELRPGGLDELVTHDNREEYVRLYVNALLIYSVSRQFNAFARGFFAVVGSPVIQLLRPGELQSLVVGAAVNDLSIVEQSAKYYPPYSPTHPLICMFWSVVHAFPPELKRRLMLFTTGCERIPAPGVGFIDFVIVPGGTDTERLPSAHTCLGMLSLPTYATPDELRHQLLIALRNAEGFGLEY